MKYLFGLAVFIMLCGSGPGDGIYNIPLKRIDGSKIDLHRFKGKKILFIVLSTSDTALAKGLAALETKYQYSLKIIGIPSEGNGFTTADKNQLTAVYKNMPSGFILTEGMMVKKGTQQSPLFHWLTSKDENTHFDRKAWQPGTKFFISETGELYAVIGPEIKLTDPFIDKIVKRK